MRAPVEPNQKRHAALPLTSNLGIWPLGTWSLGVQCMEKVLGAEFATLHMHNVPNGIVHEPGCAEMRNRGGFGLLGFGLQNPTRAPAPHPLKNPRTLALWALATHGVMNPARLCTCCTGHYTLLHSKPLNSAPTAGLGAVCRGLCRVLTGSETAIVCPRSQLPPPRPWLRRR